MSFTASLDEIVAENFNGLLSKAPHWKRFALRELASITNGVPLPSSGFDAQSGTPVIRIRNVVEGATETLFEGAVEDDWFVDHGELLIGMDGDFNAAQWKGARALLNQRVCVVRPKDTRVSLQFLAFVLPGYLAAVNKHTPSIAVKHLSSRTVGNLPIPVPPQREQGALVSAIETHFSRLDAAVASLTRAKANVKRARASVLKAAVEGRLVPTEAALARAEGRDYEPASALLERILTERKAAWTASGKKGKYKEPVAPETMGLPEVPKGWSWCTMDVLLRGIDAGKSFAADSTPPSNDQVGIVKVSAVTWGTFDEDESKTVHDPALVCPAYFIRLGDLLFSRANTIDLVGAVVIAERITRNTMLSDEILRLNVPSSLRRWVLWVLRSQLGRRQIKSLASGNQDSMRNIGQDRIRQIAVPLPPMTEQRRIVTEVDRRLSVLDAIDKNIDTNLARCARLRQSILKRAFEGRLVLAGESGDAEAMAAARVS